MNKSYSLLLVSILLLFVCMRFVSASCSLCDFFGDLFHYDGGDWGDWGDSDDNCHDCDHHDNSYDDFRAKRIDYGGYAIGYYGPYECEDDECNDNRYLISYPTTYDNGRYYRNNYAYNSYNNDYYSYYNYENHLYNYYEDGHGYNYNGYTPSGSYFQPYISTNWNF